SETDSELLYYVFDILSIDGKDITHLPLFKRKQKLASLIPQTGVIRQNPQLDILPNRLIPIVKKFGIEGIIAKDVQSPYLSGRRTPLWLKIKIQKRQEVVIGGYTKNENTSKYFSALLIGIYNK